MIVEAGRRGKDGRYTSATATLLHADGSEAEFRLQTKDIREPELQALLVRMDDRDAIVSPIKSLSVRNLMADVDFAERDARSRERNEARKRRAQRKRNAAARRRGHRKRRS